MPDASTHIWMHVPRTPREEWIRWQEMVTSSPLEAAPRGMYSKREIQKDKEQRKRVAIEQEMVNNLVEIEKKR